jgi:hypothetical protein
MSAMLAIAIDIWLGVNVGLMLEMVWQFYRAPSVGGR